MATKTVYVDLDGVLAKWRSVSVKKTRRPLYYLFLRPETQVVRLINNLSEKGYDVRILTKAYEDTSAALEKTIWLRLVGVKVPVIIVPYSDSKLSYAVDTDAILVDDFSENLHQWERAGKTGIKFRNGVNGHHNTWNGASISYTMSAEEMEKIILDCMTT